jgi:hypothetical protein
MSCISSLLWHNPFTSSSSPWLEALWRVPEKHLTFCICLTLFLSLYLGQIFPQRTLFDEFVNFTLLHNRNTQNSWCLKLEKQIQQHKILPQLPPRCKCCLPKHNIEPTLYTFPFCTCTFNQARAKNIWNKLAPVLNMYTLLFSCQYSLNNALEQLCWQPLHCLR